MISWPSRIYLTSRLFLLFVALAGFLFAGVASVSAEPRTVDSVQQYCINSLPKRAQAACEGENNKNVERMRNVASYHCQKEDFDSGEKADCIISEAQSYVDEALKIDPTPAGVTAFEKQLSTVYKKVGGNPNKPSPDSVCREESDCLQSGVGEGVDPAACTAAKQAGNKLPAGCNTNANDVCKSDNCDLIKKYVNPALEVLTVIFGLIVAASLIMGGIQYASAAGDSQKVSDAKKRITNTLIAFVAYALLFAFLQFLIPGGLFKS